MKVFGKKTLSAVLAVVMILTMCTFPAFATTKGALQKIEIATPPDKTTYIEGQSFDPTGMVVNGTYTDSDGGPDIPEAVTGYDVTPTTLSVGTTAVTITLDGKSTTQNVTVNAKTLTGITVKNNPTKLDYFVGESFSNAGTVLEAHYDNGTTADITAGYSWDKTGALTTNDTSVTFTYNGQTAVVGITVTPAVVTGVSLDKTGTLVLVQGQSLTLNATVLPALATDKSVTWQSSDETKASITYTGLSATVTGVAEGTVTVTVASVSEPSKTATVTVKVVAQKQITKIEPVTATVMAEYGTTEAYVKANQLPQVKVTYNDVEEVTMNATSWTVTGNAYSATIPGSYTFTPDVAGIKASNVNPKPVTVTVNKGVIAGYETIAKGVGVGTTETVAKNQLPTTVKARLTATKGGLTEITLNVNSTVLGPWTLTSGSFQSAVVGQVNTFTAVLTDAAKNSFTGSNPTATITVADKVTVNFQNPENAYFYGNNNKKTVNLNTSVLSAIKAQYTNETYSNFSTITYPFVSEGTVGTGTGWGTTYGVYTPADNLTQSRTATVTYEVTSTTTGVKYTGTISIKVIVAIRDVTLTLPEGTFEYAFSTSASDNPVVQINNAFVNAFNNTDSLSYVMFSNQYSGSNTAGTLYANSKLDTLSATDRYYNTSNSGYTRLSDLYFVPSGVAGNFVISYTAYGSKTGNYISGTITIVCKSTLSLEAVMNSNQPLQFTNAMFQKAISDKLDSGSTRYTLYSLTNVSKQGTSNGNLYYNYTSSSNEYISSYTTYYANPTSSSYKSLENIYYVPSSNTSGIVYVRFTAGLTSNSVYGTKTVTGVLKITVNGAADIAVSAPSGSYGDFTVKAFSDYLYQKKGSSYKMMYVVLNGAPASNTAGYLYSGYNTNSSYRITNPSYYKFYNTNTSLGGYPLSSLSFVPGSAKGTTRGTFTIYYGSSENSSTYSGYVTGNIDYVTTASATVYANVQAASKVTFSPDAFRYLGIDTSASKNINSYVTFKTLPTDGTLYYAYGTSTQTKVTAGTAYYLNYTSNSNYLGNVTFVPKYNSDKTSNKVVTIPCTAYVNANTSTACTIQITVMPATQSNQFSDVNRNYQWAADSIDFLYNKGITTGKNAYTYAPADKVTRAEFVSFLYRAAGSPAVSGSLKFKDIKSGAYYYNAVLWASTKGIVNGLTATTFGPDANVTREQIVSFMYRYYVTYLGNYGATQTLNNFTDANQVSSYAVIAMQWAVKNGFISGVTSTTLAPAANATRAEVAVFLHRLLTF